MTTIYDDRNYKITVSGKSTKTAVDLLHSTLWGTKGPLFQHMATSSIAVNSNAFAALLLL